MILWLWKALLKLSSIHPLPFLSSALFVSLKMEFGQCELEWERKIKVRLLNDILEEFSSDSQSYFSIRKISIITIIWCLFFLKRVFLCGEFFESPGSNWQMTNISSFFEFPVFGIFMCVRISQWGYVEIDDILKSIYFQYLRTLISSQKLQTWKIHYILSYCTPICRLGDQAYDGRQEKIYWIWTKTL